MSRDQLVHYPFENGVLVCLCSQVLFEMRIFVNYVKLLDQLNNVLRVSEIETLLGLDAGVLETLEDEAGLQLLGLVAWVRFGEEHGLEEEPDPMRIEEARG